MTIIGRNKNEEKIIKNVIKCGNEHVLKFWNNIDDKQKDILINQLSKIDFKKISSYYKSYLNHKPRTNHIFPAEYLSIEEREEIKDLKSIGEDALYSNKVAFLTVAGGQGSRLDYEHPKGCFPVSPVKRKSLFQIFAEKIRYYSSYYKNEFYWYIMTSEFNHKETEDFFNNNKYFGLNKNKIIFFNQGALPTLTLNGKLILQNKYEIFMNPDGHGGILKSLYKNGLLQEMKNNGIRHISYFQVDNPLANMADPYFIGYHIKKKSQVSSKVIAKLYPEERIGAICKINGINGVIEYSDLPKEKMYEKDDNGKLKYLMGSIAIHIFDLNFLIHFTKIMPMHFSIKKVKGYTFKNQNPELEEMDGIKFETYVFDSIPYSKRSIFFETKREFEFYPLKNKDGVDSIKTCTEGQNNYFYSWLHETGFIKEKYNGNNIEISPLYAPDKEMFSKAALNDNDKIKKLIYDSKSKEYDKIYIE